MKKLHRVILLSTAFFLLGGYYYWANYVESDYEVNIHYVVNQTDDMLSYDDVWGIIRANSTLPEYEIWWVMGWFNEMDDNSTQWHIIVNHKPQTGKYEANSDSYRIDAYTGEILDVGRLSFNYTPGPHTQARYDVIVLLAGMGVLLLMVYELFYRK